MLWSVIESFLRCSPRYHEGCAVLAVPGTRTLNPHPVSSMPTKNASAVWTGGLKGGNGSFKGATGITGAFTFASRFENAQGTNPEELLAAAEASCYSMALSGALEKNGTVATKIETSAACTVEKVADKMTVTRIELMVKATVPGLDNAKFQQIAAETKEGCPVSRALQKSVDISLKAQLA